LLLAISFMHCKNVNVTEEAPSRNARRHWDRLGHAPLIHYRVLDIEPMRHTLRTEGRADEVGLRKALHICRGHFATYSEARPLFGHLAGTFWKPAHVRGSLSSGAVVKDYSVPAPDES